jgi:hypothetical protein
MAGTNPSGTNVGNLLTAQAIEFDDELIPNLKSNTNAFMQAAVKRVQGEGTGINRTFFQYEELGAQLSQSTDGAIGSPTFVGQISIPAQVGEWNNYGNFSAMVVYAAIDDPVGNSAIEASYQVGQTISELYSEELDAASTVDSNVNQSSLLTTPFTMNLPTLRTMKQQLVSIGVLPPPGHGGDFCGEISPNVLGDIWNGTTVNASAIDFWKYTKEGQEMYNKMAGQVDQNMPIQLPGTGITFYQTPFVLKTANYSSGSLTAYRTYICGHYALIGVWMNVPGDTELGDGNWKTIDCKVQSDLPPTSFDPVATIGAFWSWRFHQTVTTPPAYGTLNSQRVRYADSVPAIQ